MSVQDKIFDMSNDKKALDAEIRINWNDMMANASLRSILCLRLEVLKFISTVGSSTEVRKHAKKLQEFSARITALESLPLNSKTYIKQILTPAKAIRSDFDSWKKGSITNAISPTVIKLIELEAEIESKAA